MTQATPPRITRERNPRFPAESLKESIAMVGKLFSSLGKSPAPIEAVAKGLGYAGLSGASRTALAALGYYGLLTREGVGQKVSDLALRIIRPINDPDKVSAVWEAALAPVVFADIQANHPDCTESMLAAILLRKGFTEDGAQNAAHIFKDNLEFANSLGYPVVRNEKKGADNISGNAEAMSTQVITANELPVPLGDNLVARVPFPMSEEDFELLLGTLRLWKKKLVKPARAESRPDTHKVNDE